MEFEFTEEHSFFRESIRRLAQNEVLPRAKEPGRRDKIHLDLWRKICDSGLLEIAAPHRHSEQVGDWTMLGIAAEEIAKGDVSLASMLVPNVSLCILLQNASQELQKKWLPPLIRGENLGCVAITEPESGTDVAAMKMTATRAGDQYLLTGEKRSVSCGLIAHLAALLAKMEPDDGISSVSCFLLPLDSPKIIKSMIPDMGLKPIARASIVVDREPIPKEYLIGEEGEGLQLIAARYDVTRLLVALISIGAAVAVVEKTISYVKERFAFGKPLGQFEGVSFKLAEAATLLEASRALCYRALWMRDQGFKHTKESTMCKWWSTKIAVDVIHEALLLHGHFGYSTEALIERQLKIDSC
jgi:cyclohexanecarboxyl-CoA dehydrogenase